MIKKSIFLIFVICINSEAQSPLKLWYNSSAKTFDEALLIGNGKQGATIYGGVEKEIISLNDLSLWSGGPNGTINNEPQAKTQINELIISENYIAKDSLNNDLYVNNIAAYCPLGEVSIDFKKENTSNYYRELSINDAVAKVLYDTPDNSYYREYFFSYPDNALVIKINTKKAKSLNFSLGFQSQLQHKKEIHNPLLYIEGRAPYIIDTNNIGFENPLSNKSTGTRFSARILIEQKGGEIFNSDSTLIVENANEAIIKICMATSFNGYSKNPEKDGKNNKAIADERIRSVINSDFYLLKMRHVKDYTKYFSRVKLYLGEDKYSDLSTSDRLRIYDKFGTDTYLEALFFQYSRYLLISSSRLPFVPINPLGLWSSKLNPIQNNYYNMHFGIEENYWLAESTNLPEMHSPFLSFIENLEKNGISTARNTYDSPGWVCHLGADIWANTNRQSDKIWDLGGIIATSHLWVHYLYTQDKEFLKTKAYPIMKSAADYALNSILNKDQEVFPESNEKYIIINQLFNDIKLAATELKIQDDFTAKINAAINTFSKSTIIEAQKEAKGYKSLMNKPVEYYGIFPGSISNFQYTSEFMESAKNTLESNHFINAHAWKMNLLARLGNGNKAHEILKNHLKKTNTKTPNEESKIGVYSNLLIKTPENEIACNFGIAAGISEMLLQSSPGKIIVLPALPDAWPKGSVKGLKTIGGFEVDISWENGKLSDLLIKSESGGETKMYYRGNVKQIKLKAGKKVNFKSI